jgi:hypothetical protein
MTAASTAPGVQWVRVDSPGLRRVGAGLLIEFCATLAQMGCTLFFVVFVQFLAREMIRGGMSVEVAQAMVYFLMGIILLATALRIVGMLLCLAVPEESGAKGLIIVAVVLMLCAVAIDLSTLVVRTEAAVQFVSRLLGLLGWIFFILFLRKTSHFIGRADLAAQAGSLLGMVAALVALAVVLGVVAALQIGVPGLLLILALLLIVLGISLLIRYLVLIHRLRVALRP